MKKQDKRCNHTFTIGTKGWYCYKCGLPFSSFNRNFDISNNNLRDIKGIKRFVL